jgi:hypothetical protein
VNTVHERVVRSVSCHPSPSSSFVLFCFIVSCGGGNSAVGGW